MTEKTEQTEQTKKQLPVITEEEKKEGIEICDRMLGKARKHWKVKHLVNSMEKLGCKIPPTFFTCSNCEKDSMLGGFMPNKRNPKVRC